MACEGCKNKEIIKVTKKSKGDFTKTVHIFIVIWFFLGLYGLYSLASDIINWLQNVLLITI